MTMALQPTPDVRVVGATVVFAALATVVFGLWPALRLSRTDTIRALNDQTGGLGGARRWFSTGNVLVTAQMALSLALLVVSALFVRAALLGAKADPGFALDRTVHAEVDPALAGLDEARGRDVQRRLLERMRSLPGVEAASTASVIPFGDISITRRVQADGPRLRGNEPGAGDKLVGAQYYVVGADYFRTLNIERIAGREFTPAEEQPSSGVISAIIDEPLASRLFPGVNPVGRRLQFAADDDDAGSDRAVEIVGVVKGTRHDLFDREPQPHLYLPSGQAYVSTTHLHIRAADGSSPAHLLDTVRREIRDDRAGTAAVHRRDARRRIARAASGCGSCAPRPGSSSSSAAPRRSSRSSGSTASRATSCRGGPASSASARRSAPRPRASSDRCSARASG